MFLAFAGHFALVEISGAFWMQVVISLFGIIAMIATAALITWYKDLEGRSPGQRPKSAGCGPRWRGGMRAFIAVLLAASAIAGQALAVDPPSCAVPDNLLFVDNSLNRVTTAVGKQHQLAIAVFGTGSSTIGGADGPSLAYPARLEVALNQKLSNVTVRVATRTKTGQTADIMRRNMKDLLVDEKPNLVIWQTGTVDAIRRVDLDDFRAALEAGVDTLQNAGTDVILMNMQYSPRTEFDDSRRSLRGRDARRGAAARGPAVRSLRDHALLVRRGRLRLLCGRQGQWPGAAGA